MAKRSLALSPTRLAALRAFQRIQGDDLLALPRRKSREIRGTLVRAVLEGQDPATLLDEVRAITTSTTAQAESLYETGLSQFQQLLITTERQALSYVYSGPVDGRIRRFCLARVGRIFSRSDIDEMDNGQLPNVFLTRGGWRCRHLWRPATTQQREAVTRNDGLVSQRVAGKVATQQRARQKKRRAA